jgi:hypothetical protein
MKRLLASVLGLTAAVVLVVALGASAKAPHAKGGARGTTVITVIEHATNDSTTDTGPVGDSPGDVLTFANDVFDAADRQKVGTDHGYCLRVVANTSFECAWTTFLPAGQIEVSGPFFDAKDSKLAITGGTGRYRKARGTMDLHALAGGTKFSFTFHITR